jgi:hypothetical protein
VCVCEREAKKPNNLPELNLQVVVLFLDSINFIALQKINLKPALKKRRERPNKRWELLSQRLSLPPEIMVSANGFAGVWSERW